MLIISILEYQHNMLNSGVGDQNKMNIKYESISWISMVLQDQDVNDNHIGVYYSDIGEEKRCSC